MFSCSSKKHFFSIYHQNASASNQIQAVFHFGLFIICFNSSTIPLIEPYDFMILSILTNIFPEFCCFDNAKGSFVYTLEDDPCLYSQITWKPEPQLLCYWLSNIHDSEKGNQTKPELTEKSSVEFSTGAVPNWCFPPGDFQVYCLHFHPQLFLLQNHQCLLFQISFIQVCQSHAVLSVSFHKVSQSNLLSWNLNKKHQRNTIRKIITVKILNNFSS